MTLRELIAELHSKPERLLDADVFVWHDRGGSEPVRGVSVQGNDERPVVVIHTGEKRRGRAGRA
jgi:hypothetical protein